MTIKNARYVDDKRPVDDQCDCYACTHFSRAYLRHLFMARELLAYRLNTIHNLRYYMCLMEGMRKAIEAENMDAFRKMFYETQTGHMVD